MKAPVMHRSGAFCSVGIALPRHGSHWMTWDYERVLKRGTMAIIVGAPEASPSKALMHAREKFDEPGATACHLCYRGARDR